MEGPKGAATWPSVTVLLTVRNVEATIEACLRSVLEQEYPAPVDVVVVEAFSTDATPRIIQSLQGGRRPLRMVALRSTQPQAYNHAIDAGLLTGEIVAMIDGDCVAEPGWLQALVNPIREGWEAAGGIGLTPSGVPLLSRVIGYDLDYRFLSTPEGRVLRHPNMSLAVRRDVLQKLRFDETLIVGYDTDFGYRLSAAGFRIAFTKRAKVRHYHRSTLKGYARQQFQSARYALLVYRKQPRGLKGDNINPPWMLAQPVLAGAAAILLVLGLAWPPLALAGLACLAALLLVLLAASVRVARALREPRAAFALPALYLVRLPFWGAGIAAGVLDAFAGRSSRGPGAKGDPS